ncbi:sugar ABC transporter permease [Paenibacillus dendritiformis]|uniref:CUT1 family carbohydrate ABC transporter membrane protein 1 n=1 Tax=Paenibacillus dendritiformis C454 TaxID=1131935 RepID=H3SHD0_9BACL|nr:ABC transporter permease subunit [Paenibacillus dendritiformis]EHQ61565.1 CUT1 family carbohydrate ABC transporter membrane protein 1 [Paenibacillus dendritiformis C454]PZM63583.1 sugar ABC transporter permease [Paenibacillus dendritiformis]TDL49811.1 sugar ABC transporter permease [Paenibacillus dendritiformis]WGU96182.1 sugar ABC transporter permease [Paenibacillus dendritiformis]CAH8770693.1 sugar ABC transporter permease [Paenibacillus dendritiformis]
MKLSESKRDNMYFYLFISPWLIGFIVFALYPILASLYYSFTDYDIISSPHFIGLDNYKELFEDELFYKSIVVTLKYTLISVPLGLFLSLIFAMLINMKIPARGFFRTAMYFPSMVSGVSMSLLWFWIFNPEVGVFNYILSWFGVKGPAWFLDENFAIWALIIMTFWGVGAGMIIFLAGLQGVPSSLLEAAKLDGAGRWKTFWNVTFPMISPVFLFQLIMSVIESFQVFTQAYVMTQGGPNYSTRFYVYNVYVSAFKDFRLGYASAMAWLLLLAILIITVIIMKSSNRFVYYEGGRE